MSMSKKDFIELADVIKEVNRHALATGQVSVLDFGEYQINALADFCQSQNPNFKRDRWLDYIAGKVGPNGGKV